MDSWSRSSLVIRSNRLEVSEIAGVLGCDSMGRGEAWVMSADSAEHDENAFEAQIVQLKEFLTSNARGLRSISASAEIVLYLSWTPRTPQDSVTFDPALVQALGSLNGYIVLDTYADD